MDLILSDNEIIRVASDAIKGIIALEGLKGRDHDSCFYFFFTDEEKEEDNVYGFTFDKACAQTVEDLQEFSSDNNNWFLDLASGIESLFGVHDWSSSPRDEVRAIGYTSYEVSPENYLTCMTLWRDEMANILGEENVGKVTHIAHYSVNDDEDTSEYDAVSSWSDLDISNQIKLKETPVENSPTPKI